MLDFIKSNWSVIATALLGVSEGLSLIPGVKSNGIIQAVLNFIKNMLAQPPAAPKA